MAQGTNKRKFVLPSLSEFQRKLDDFYQSVSKPRQEGKQDYEAYVLAICESYRKGMTMREISAATGMRLQTIAYWLKKKGVSRKTAEVTSHA